MSKLNTYTEAKKLITMAVLLSLDGKFREGFGLPKDAPRKNAGTKVFLELAKIFMQLDEFGGVDIEKLRLEIQEFAYDGISSVFDEVFSIKRGPDAIDTLSRH